MVRFFYVLLVVSMEEELINEIVEPPVKTFAEASIQTDKRQISDKQREALQKGRMLYKDRRDAYKKWAEEQQSIPVVRAPPPVVRQEVRAMSFV
jgi:hypothetical protein